MAALDTYELYDTLADPDATSAEKIFTAGGFVLGAISPGGGSSFIGKRLGKGLETALSAYGSGKLDANKLHHIFGKARHRLDDVIKTYGSQERAYGAIVDRTEVALHKAGLKSGTFEKDIAISGKIVTVRGS